MFKRKILLINTILILFIAFISLASETIASEYTGEIGAGNNSITNPIGDVAPPVRDNGLPTGTLVTGTVETTLSLVTDEDAICKYGTPASVSYNEMADTFSSTDSTTHSQTITGLTNGNSYTYYIKCQDDSANANTDDYTISFSIASPQNTGGGGNPTGGNNNNNDDDDSNNDTSDDSEIDTSLKTSEVKGATTTEILDGDIIQCQSSDNPFAVYIVKIVGDTKYIRHIVSLEIFNYYGHLQWENLKQVDSLSDYSLSGWVRYNTGENNTPAPTDKVYEINGDQTRHWINMTAEQFLSHGGSEPAIFNINQGELSLYITGADVMSL